MLITEEQIKNDYPLQAVKFMKTFDKYLSDETDDFGLKLCKSDSFDAFKEVGADVPQKLMTQYEESIALIHEYLKKGFHL